MLQSSLAQQSPATIAHYSYRETSTTATTTISSHIFHLRHIFHLYLSTICRRRRGPLERSNHHRQSLVHRTRPRFGWVVHTEDWCVPLESFLNWAWDPPHIVLGLYTTWKLTTEDSNCRVNPANRPVLYVYLRAGCRGFPPMQYWHRMG